MGKKIGLRLWLAANTLLDLFYTLKNRRQWHELRKEIFMDDFVRPFKTGHIPVRFFDSILEAEFLLKPRFMNSVEAIVENVRSGLYNLLGRPYYETRVIKRYALALIGHLDSCPHCQAKAVQYAATLHALRLKAAKRTEQTDVS